VGIASDIIIIIVFAALKSVGLGNIWSYLLSQAFYQGENLQFPEKWKTLFISIASPDVAFDILWQNAILGSI
jgi:hypothetical protein